MENLAAGEEEASEDMQVLVSGRTQRAKCDPKALSMASFWSPLVAK